MASALSSHWFTRLFAGAAIAHIAGNAPRTLGALGVATLALGLVAAVLIVRPQHRWLRVLLGVLVIVTMFFEAPFLGNHWLVAAFVAAALLGASFASNWWRSFAPMARAILLVFYSFAAFAKLNEGFFDPVNSCGLFYANQWLNSWGLPQLPPGDLAPLTVALLAAAIELAVPVLLLVRRTRPYGVMLGFAFHFAISLDLHQHFYDFTAVLLALFTLFIEDRHTDIWESRAVQHERSLGAIAAAGMALTALAVLPPSPATDWILDIGAFLVWIPVGLVLVVGVLRMPTTLPARIRLVPGSVAGGVLVLLVVINGLTPYLGVKTAYGFNMYANLSTAEGESNHFVIRQTAQFVDVEMVSITASSDPGLAAYVDSGLLVPERNIRHHLASRPTATVTYIGQAGIVTGTGAELGERLPLLVEKFGLFRSIDSGDQPRCQTVWLPAY
ncbi:MAG: hypothetical protein ACFCVC_19470 [Acidimicrobiia bacterium]